MLKPEELVTLKILADVSDVLNKFSSLDKRLEELNTKFYGPQKRTKEYKALIQDIEAQRSALRNLMDELASAGTAWGTYSKATAQAGIASAHAAAQIASAQAAIANLNVLQKQQQLSASQQKASQAAALAEAQLQLQAAKSMLYTHRTYNAALQSSLIQERIAQAKLRTQITAIRAASAEEKKAAGPYEALIGRVTRSATSVASIISGMAIFSMLTNFVRQGIQFSSTLEDSVMMLTGMLLTYNEIADSQGRVLTGAERISGAIKISKRLTEELVELDKKLPATYDELLEIAKLVTAYSSGKGLTPEMIASITGILALPLKLFVPTKQAYTEEVRSVMTGIVSLQHSTLATRLGLDAEKLRTLKGAQFVSYLTTALRGFTEIEAELSALYSVAINQARTALAMTSARVFDGLIKNIIMWSDQLVKWLDSRSGAVTTQTFSYAVEAMAATIVQIAKGISEVFTPQGLATMGFASIMAAMSSKARPKLAALKSTVAIIGTGIAIDFAKQIDDTQSFIQEYIVEIGAIGGMIGMLLKVPFTTGFSVATLAALAADLVDKQIRKADIPSLDDIVTAWYDKMDEWKAAVKRSVRDYINQLFDSSTVGPIPIPREEQVQPQLQLIPAKTIELLERQRDAVNMIVSAINADIYGNDLDAQRMKLMNTIATMQDRFKDYLGVYINETTTLAEFLDAARLSIDTILAVRALQDLHKLKLKYEAARGSEAAKEELATITAKSSPTYLALKGAGYEAEAEEYLKYAVALETAPKQTRRKPRDLLTQLNIEIAKLRGDLVEYYNLLTQQALDSLKQADEYLAASDVEKLELQTKTVQKYALQQTAEFDKLTRARDDFIDGLILQFAKEDHDLVKARETAIRMRLRELESQDWFKLFGDEDTKKLVIEGVDRMIKDAQRSLADVFTDIQNDLISRSMQATGRQLDLLMHKQRVEYEQLMRRTDITQEDKAKLSELLLRVQRQELVTSQEYISEVAKRSYPSAFQLAIENMKDSLEVSGKDIVDMANSISNSMTSAFQRFFDRTSKEFLDFGDLVKNILNDIYLELVRMTVSKPMTNLLFSLFKYIAPAPSVPPTTSAEQAAWGFETIHKGGFVYFHRGGLAYDEVPAILQRGEYVVSRKGVEALDRLNSGITSQPNVTVNVVNNSSAQVATEDVSFKYDDSLDSYIVSVVLRDINTGGKLRYVLGGGK